MFMPVVNVRGMNMIMRDYFMRVLVRMLRYNALRMIMSMVHIVMSVFMRMSKFFMSMNMLMSFRYSQISAEKHNRECDKKYKTKCFPQDKP